MGASPILVDGKLIQVCDQDLDAFVIAVDPADGEILWKQARPDVVHSFSTPVVHDRGQGSPEIIVPGSYRMTGYAARRPRTLAARRTDLPGQVRTCC